MNSRTITKLEMCKTLILDFDKNHVLSKVKFYPYISTQSIIHKHIKEIIQEQTLAK